MYLGEAALASLRLLAGGVGDLRCRAVVVWPTQRGVISAP